MNCLARAFPALLLLPALIGQIDAVRTSFGVTTHEGVVCGLGPDYSARFAATGVTFTPLLGRRVTEPAALRFTLSSVRRGETSAFTRRHDIEPVAAGNQVRYLHDPKVVEVYDVEEEGIEQSFVFAQRPAGTGDLVVCGVVDTDLPLARADDDGVHFERPDVGGVTFGAVTGVDANGARMRGSLRCDGRNLELSLPASFVDSAAYPLVLDPLIGSSFLIANIAGGSDVLPSLAYDESTQRYLVVWHVGVSATVAEVRAQFVSAAGLVGPQMLLDATAVAGVRPVVANINQHDRFVVAWGANQNQAEITTVAAATGVVTGSLTWGFAQALVGLAIGGDSRTPLAGNADYAVLVATTSGPVGSTSSAFRMMLQVPASGFVTAGTTTPIMALLARFGPPTITKHGGSSGRWMSAFAYRLNGSNSGAYRVDVVNASGTLCDFDILSIGSAPNDTPRTAAATLDGNSFLLAYEDFSTIRLRRVYTSSCGAAMALYPVFDVPTPGRNDFPELDCARDKYFLAWRNTPTAATVADVYVQGIGLQSGAGAAQVVVGSLSAQIDPAVASRWSGGDSASDEGLVTWASAGIRGRLWQTKGTGTIANLGGACGTSGLNDFASYTGSPVLGTTLTLSLLAPTAPVLALIVGFSSTPFACGPCTVIPSPDILLAGGGPVPVNVPLDGNLIGLELFTQWLQLRASGCPILPDFGFSNTLKFTIAE